MIGRLLRFVILPMCLGVGLMLGLEAVLGVWAVVVLCVIAVIYALHQLAWLHDVTLDMRVDGERLKALTGETPRDGDWLNEVEDARDRYRATPRWRLWRRRVHRQAWESAVMLLMNDEVADARRRRGIA